MDALLLALLLCLIVESGGKMAMLYQALHHHYGPPAGNNGMAVTISMIMAVTAHAAIAAYAGHLLATMMTPEARRLFLAITLASAGIGLILPRPAVTLPTRPYRNPVMGNSIPLFLRGIGGNAPFLIMGAATATAWPWLAGIGGATGSIAACLFLYIAGPNLSAKALRVAHIIIGGCLLPIAFFIAVEAMRLS